jgi:hypothetical protein
VNNQKAEDLLQQIAIDVAVIKAELAVLKPLREQVAQNREDIVELKSQLQIFRWVGGIVSTSFFGIFIKLFHDRLV